MLLDGFPESERAQFAQGVAVANWLLEELPFMLREQPSGRPTHSQNPGVRFEGNSAAEPAICWPAGASRPPSDSASPTKACHGIAERADLSRLPEVYAVYLQAATDLLTRA